MSKSQLYQSISKGNSNDLLDFLLSKGVWSSPELDCIITVSFSINEEQIEFPLYRNLPQSKITEILEKFGLSSSDFEEYMKGSL